MAAAATVLLLIGPKGSGKTFIGSLIRERLGVPFLHVESIFLENIRRSRLEGTARDAEGYGQVLAEVDRSLATAPRLALESTGAADAFPPFLDELRSRHRVLLVSVRAPPQACLERVQIRDGRDHIPVSDDRVAEINRRAAQVRLAWDLEIDNGGPASPEAIVTAVGGLLHARDT